MRKFFVTIFFYLVIINVCLAQENSILLWTENIPNFQASDEIETQNKEDILWIENVQDPSLEIFLPSPRNATGAGMIICPGGGYQGLAYDWEGSDIAKWLNSKGIAAFVLKYRLPKSKSVILGNEAPLEDAQRAIRLVRKNAEKWKVSKNKIGIMGFSAGGHLASTLGTHYDKDKNATANGIDSLSARPDFMVLVYPVITMKTSITHQGSMNNLLGMDPSQELMDFYSNEMHVTKNTPPTFIVHATDDKAVSVMNSILFYQALLEEGVYTEMHIYPEGGHGFGLAIGNEYLQTWTDRLDDWMEGLNKRYKK